MQLQGCWYCLCHANSGTSRRGSTRRTLFLLPSFCGAESTSVSLSFISFIFPSLSRIHSFTPAFPSLSPLVAERARVSPSPHTALSVAFPFSRFRIRLSRTVAAISLSFCDRVAHPIPSPCSRRRRPSPAGGRRTSVPLAHNPSTKRAIRNN